MKFTWDEKKRITNLRHHGFDFVDAPSVFDGLTFTYEDDRFDYGEQRFVTLGMLHGWSFPLYIRKHSSVYT
jgi:uncharacterized DUF497 family protein